MPEKPAMQKRNERIWRTICDVPEGSVASYGQIAEITGIPRGARQVGFALRHLPKGHEVPWHRIITSSGRIAFDKGSRPYREQVKRLKMEGIAVIRDIIVIVILITEVGKLITVVVSGF